MLLNDAVAATRILLVEDEAIIALDLRHRLESLGFSVTGIAVNGADAESLALSTRPGLILMDITIQGPRDGIETAKAIQKVMDIPIVFLTAHADTGTIRRAKEAKPYGYLVKPFEERELATTIEMAVYRHQAEAQARLMQQAVASASTGMVIADARDPKRGIILCNPAFERLSGYSHAEVMGRPPWFLEGPATDEQTAAEFRQAYEDGSERQATLLLHRRDGSQFWSDVSLSSVRDSAGVVTHSLLFLSDATARKDAEVALFQAQKVEAIGQLAGGVAHDFNNILAVITGYCEMAQRQVEPAHPVRARLDQILKAANRAAALTRQLLAFSRRQILQPRPLDLNTIVADTHKMLGRLIGEDIVLSLKPGPELGTVSADPGQVEQIVLNLAVNARDAMPRGGMLTLETRNVTVDDDLAGMHRPMAPGSYVLLTVADTGTGMTADVKARVFEPFFTTKPEGHGTGLGLATVYGIVKQSGGFIWFDTEPGRGTSFRIYFPRVEAGRSGGEGEAGHRSMPRGVETVLLAEDNESLREVIRETLVECGYDVIVARDGREALAAARAHPGEIHLLLTDVVMPNMGGADLARALRDVRPEARVMFMSGYTDGALHTHGVLSEGVVLIEKPFTTDRLAVMVRDALDRATPPALPA